MQLEGKRVKPYNLRVHAGRLVVPVRAGEDLCSLQFISDEGGKVFLKGGRVSGCYHLIGEPNGVLCVAEGLATGASVHESTGHAVAVAFNAGNLKPVALAMRERFPNASLIVCADNDVATPGNPGLTKAREAAEVVGAVLRVPDFGEDRPRDATDFNDMYRLRGKKAVRDVVARAEHGDAAVSTASADDVLKTFREWLYIPDEGSVCVPLAAIAANLMEGDPVWLMTVGPPSGGKTEIIVAAASLPYVRLGATLTEASLLSGTPKKQMAAGSKGGLLREIGDFGILALKDFTSVLSMNRDTRAQLLAALREVFDGSWTRHVGTDGGRTLAWSGKLGLIAGCTAAIDSFHGVMSVMGERFLLYRLPDIDPKAQAERAISNSGKGGAMRKELAAVVGRLFAGLNIGGKELPPLDEDEVDGLVALSSLVAAARSAVERNPYGSREIDLILDTEAPARLAQTLCRLYAGLGAIGLARARAWKLVVKTGLDCIPKLRRAVFDVLVATTGWMTTKAVAARIQHPTMTARRALEDLSAHGVVDRQPAEKGKGDGKSDYWQLSATARGRHKVIVTEMSVEESGTNKCTTYTNSINTHPHFDDDITVTMPESYAECGSQGGFDVAETPGDILLHPPFATNVADPPDATPIVRRHVANNRVATPSATSATSATNPGEALPPDASLLADWLSRVGPKTPREVQQFGPAALRDKARRDAAIDELVEAGLVVVDGDGTLLLAGHDAESPGEIDEPPDRHCWKCKGTVDGTDRCEVCGWITCECGACSPECGDTTQHTEVTT